MTLDLTDDEKVALAAFLKRTIEDDGYSLSPRLHPLAPGGGPALKRTFGQRAAVDPIELGSNLGPRIARFVLLFASG
jgi:hypothetical protein